MRRFIFRFWLHVNVALNQPKISLFGLSALFALFVHNLCFYNHHSSQPIQQHIGRSCTGASNTIPHRHTCTRTYTWTQRQMCQFQFVCFVTLFVSCVRFGIDAISCELKRSCFNKVETSTECTSEWENYTQRPLRPSLEVFVWSNLKQDFFSTFKSITIHISCVWLV